MVYWWLVKPVPMRKVSWSEKSLRKSQRITNLPSKCLNSDFRLESFAGSTYCGVSVNPCRV